MRYFELFSHFEIVDLVISCLRLRREAEHENEYTVSSGIRDGDFPVVGERSNACFSVVKDWWITLRDPTVANLPLHQSFRGIFDRSMSIGFFSLLNIDFFFCCFVAKKFLEQKSLVIFHVILERNVSAVLNLERFSRAHFSWLSWRILLNLTSPHAYVLSLNFLRKESFSVWYYPSSK